MDAPQIYLIHNNTSSDSIIMSSTPKKVSVGKIHKSSTTGKGGSSSNGGIWESVSRFFNVKYVVVLAVLLALATFSFVLYKKSTSVIQNYINASDDVLKKVIFGEQPHVWLCDRNTANPTAASSPAGKRGNDAMLSISPLFTQLHTLKGQDYPFGVLNCSHILPSGKSIAERFKLKKEVKPAIWVTAPWTKAVQASPKDMKDINLLAKFIDQSLKPKATVIKSDKQLQSFCNFQNKIVLDDRDITETCFVFLRGEKHSKSQMELEEKLVIEYPKSKFAAVDGKKLRLSFENVEDLPVDHFALKIHALRNGTHFMSMENPLTWDYATTFMSHAVASPLYGFKEHDRKDIVRLVKPSTMQRKAKKAAKKKNKKVEEPVEDVENNDSGDVVDDKQKRKEARARERKRIAAEQKKKRADQAGSKETAKEEEDDVNEEEEASTTTIDPEQLRQEQLQRERKRREEMEAQERAHLFEEEEDAEEEEEGEVEEEGDDEEHIEL